MLEKARSCDFVMVTLASMVGSWQLSDRLQQLRPMSLTTLFCSQQRPGQEERANRKEVTYPQNVDLPPLLPKKKKKPYPVPLRNIQLAARKDKKLTEMGIEKPLQPPDNGLLVPDLIPVAYEVLDAWKLLIRGLSQLMHVVPVYGCR